MFVFSSSGSTLAASLGPIVPDAPAREPQMAVNGSMVALAFGAGNGIYFSSSADAGKTFSAPREGRRSGDRAAHAPSRPAGSHFPGRTIVITAVVGKTSRPEAHAHGLPSDGDLIAWRSDRRRQDAGRREWWSTTFPALRPKACTRSPRTRTGTYSRRGSTSVAATGPSCMARVRPTAALTWSKNVMIYESPEGTICECCHPSVAMDPDGQILVMWRNWLAGSRDMYLARSRDGVTFSKPEKLGTGTWQLNACPMDGGGLVISQNRVVTAWRREHEIFLASPGEKEVGIGEGVDVALAAAPSGVYAIWSTPTGIRALTAGKERIDHSRAKRNISEHCCVFPTGTCWRPGKTTARFAFSRCRKRYGFTRQSNQRSSTREEE